MSMEMDEILALIPHRPPILLVDRVLELEPGRRIVATKQVAPGPWATGAPEALPGTLVLEAMAQCGGILALRTLGHQTQPKDVNFYFLGVEQCQFQRPVQLGDQLRLEVEVLRDKGKVFKLRGRALAGDTLVCEAQLTIAQQAVGGSGA
jgi:3-hydroxyacyl-[acyl-carrier-protein] dehydratase